MQKYRMVKNTTLTGRTGEEMAAQYLCEKGYRILERNWYDGHREIDLIALKEGVLVFVEVKTRRGIPWVDPVLSVTRKKQERLVAAAHAYVEKKRMDMKVRFDVITICGSDNQLRIEQYEDAIIPGLRK